MKRMITVLFLMCGLLAACGGKTVPGGYSSTTTQGTGGASIGGPTVQELEAQLVKLRDVEFYAFLVYCRSHNGESPCTQAEVDAAIEPVNAGFRALTIYKANPNPANGKVLQDAVKKAEESVAKLPKA